MSENLEMVTQQVKLENTLMRIHRTWRGHSLLKETSKAG